MTVEPYRYLVTSPILHPVAARAGDVVSVVPGHATRPVVVIRKVAGKWQPIRVGPPNYGAIQLREEEGSLTLLVRPAISLSQHPAVRSA